MSCTCHACKQKYTVDLIVSDELWITIYTEDKEKAAAGGGMLCPQCILSRLPPTYFVFKQEAAHG